VLEERKAETIVAMAPFRRDPSLFVIMARLTSEEHFDVVRNEIYRTLEEAGKSPLASDRLDAIKSHMRFAFAMGLDSADAVARTLGEYLQLTGDPSSVNRMYETYDAATYEDIQNVAARYFVASNRTVVTLRAESGSADGSSDAAVGLRPPVVSSRVADSLGIQQDALWLSAHSTIDAPVDASCESAAGSVEEQDIRKANMPATETILPNVNSPLVAIRLLFNVGSKDDPAGREGLAALTARMLTEGGTKRFNYDEILERLYPMAAETSAHCDKELTTFVGNVHRDKLDEFYDLFYEMLTAPRFDPEDFARLREEQLNYVSTTLRGNNDEAFGKATLQQMLYPDHPYGHVEAGTISGLRSI
jgi:zinc protease